MKRAPSRLQQEIKQRQPFRSPAHEAAVGLLRTADVVRHYIAEVLAPYGITYHQYNVLRILRGAGASGLPTLEVAQRVIEQTPGITRLLDRLERNGWVRRERCADDRRQVLCYITRPGKALVDRLDEPIHQADQDLMAGLTEAEQRQLIRLLDKARNP